MIGYAIPLERFPNTYNGQPLGIAALASQKNYMAVYIMNVYADKRTLDLFVKEWRASGKWLDMGKSCVRFRRLEDLPLEVIGKEIARNSVEDVIAAHEMSHGGEAGNQSEGSIAKDGLDWISSRSGPR
ncbi:MAG TPA: DUF1801 domain-containing protein [Thermoplasmata archaeon]|nr:DUF1801 domain-containing protein [Thermoplasmata archaeon]